MAQATSAPPHNLRVGEHRVEVEPTPRWLRVELNGVTIADSKHAVLLRETGHLPVYYFPPEDVRMDLMTPTETHTTCPYKGLASYWSIKVGDRDVKDVVWSYQDPLPGREDIQGFIAFYWNKVDHWYEEAEEIFKHPRDPYHRVDAIQSARKVKVMVGGQVVAETERPVLLFETSLPTRYYISKDDVRLDLLEATDTQSTCPYKGNASYWKPKGGDRDIAWAYENPIKEIPAIKGLIAFFNERVDAIDIDGEVEQKPRTNWS